MKGEVTALILLDLSAAFDTIDHAILTDIFSVWYGISGRAQIWFSPYLKKRAPIRKKHCEIKSHSHIYGVPRGSVLGDWDHCVLSYRLHHSALLSLVLT